MDDLPTDHIPVSFSAYFVEQKEFVNKIFNFIERHIFSQLECDQFSLGELVSDVRDVELLYDAVDVREDIVTDNLSFFSSFLFFSLFSLL